MLKKAFPLLIALHAASALTSLDFSRLGGSISFFGDFNGLSFYKTANESALLIPNDPGILGFYVRNTTSNAISTKFTLDGTVIQTVPLTDDTALLLGNYTHINGAPAAAPVLYNGTSGLFSSIWSLALDEQQEGTVRSALVDGLRVYLGGDFVFNNTRAVAVYDMEQQTLLSTPFLGFGEKSLVNSIAKYADDGDSPGSIVFGGKFDTLGNPLLLMHNVTSNVPVDNTYTGLLSAEQVVSLKHAILTLINGAPGNNDAAVICPPLSSVWSVTEHNGGHWAAELDPAMKGTTPTKVRIYLPPDSGNGIKTFRIYTYPNNGIMNLTYVDPQTNERKFCDASCPLLDGAALRRVAEANSAKHTQMSDNNSVYVDSHGSYMMYPEEGVKTRNLGYGANYQEFALVNRLPVDKFGLTVVDWYGNRAEFAGLKIFQEEICVYANNTLNEPNCGDFPEYRRNMAHTNSGNWQSILELNSGVTKEYLVSVVGSGGLSLTLHPNVTYDGIYSLLLYTPGCAQDGSCAKRSIINATVIDANGTTVASKQIYQNSLEDKFDYLYYGHLDRSTGDGRALIRLDYVRPVDEAIGVDLAWMVAEKAVANIVLLDDVANLFVLHMPLHGLFEYSLANFSETNTFVGNSAINRLSGNLSADSSVSQVLVSAKTLALLGKFLSAKMTVPSDQLLTLLLSGYDDQLNEISVSSISKRDEQTIPGATLDSSITGIFAYGGGVVLVGAFQMSGDFRNLAANNASAQTAENFALVDGGHVYTFLNAHIDADFSQFSVLHLGASEYFVFSSADGHYATWDNTRKTWQTADFVVNVTSAPALAGVQLVAGPRFVYMDAAAIDGVFFSNSSTMQSYDLNVSGTIDTLFRVNSSYAVVGGSFRTNDSASHVAVLRDSVLEPITEPSMWDDAAAVLSLFFDDQNSFLYVGSNGSVRVGDAAVTGLSVYNLANHSLPALQPPSLSTTNGSAIQVNALALYEERMQLLVGGRFDRAGSLECGALCLYDIPNTRWINPQTGALSATLSGIVTDAKFLSSSVVLVGGNFTFNGTATNFLTYNFHTNSFAVPPAEFSSVGVGAGVSKFIINDSSNKQFHSRVVAMGDTFVAGFNRSAWERIDEAIEFGPETVLTDLKLVQLSARSANNSGQQYFNSDKALMLSGVFSLKGHGTVNVAIYDGAEWAPYVFALKGAEIGLVKSISLQDIHMLQSSSDLDNLLGFLSTGKVVGVSLACALGATAFLGIIYIVPLFLMRAAKKKEPSRKRVSEDDMMHIVDPGDLLHEMDLQRNY